ncbi:MAG: hypothetical protein V9G10_11260 [Candidatus Nanopelagicales bacterium]
MFATRSAITAMGGPHVRFDQVGGGALNPDLFRELAELPQTQLVILPGEASFHQFHGGVTTSQDDQREDKLAAVPRPVRRDPRIGVSLPAAGADAVRHRGRPGPWSSCTTLRCKDATGSRP